MSDRIDRRAFLSRVMILLMSVISVLVPGNLGKTTSPPGGEFSRTSRKKAKYSRELAG